MQQNKILSFQSVSAEPFFFFLNVEKSHSPDTTDRIQPDPHAISISNTTKLAHYTHDEGAQPLQEVQEYIPEELETESAKVRRLIDWNIMPIVSSLWKVDCHVRANTDVRSSSRVQYSF